MKSEIEVTGKASDVYMIHASARSEVEIEVIGSVEHVALVITPDKEKNYLYPGRPLMADGKVMLFFEKEGTVHYRVRT